MTSGLGSPSKSVSLEPRASQATLHNSSYDLGRSPNLAASTRITSKIQEDYYKHHKNPQIKINNNLVEDLAKRKEIGGLAPSDRSPLREHNPITNPLAYVNQNPYVNKQIGEAQYRTPTLQSTNPAAIAKQATNSPNAYRDNYAAQRSPNAQQRPSLSNSTTLVTGSPGNYGLERNGKVHVKRGTGPEPGLNAGSDYHQRDFYTGEQSHARGRGWRGVTGFDLR